MHALLLALSLGALCVSGASEGWEQPKRRRKGRKRHRAPATPEPSRPTTPILSPQFQDLSLSDSRRSSTSLSRDQSGTWSRSQSRTPTHLSPPSLGGSRRWSNSPIRSPRYPQGAGRRSENSTPRKHREFRFRGQSLSRESSYSNTSESREVQTPPSPLNKADFTFCEVNDLYYTHGNSEIESAFPDQLSVQFREGRLPGLKREVRPTIYDTVFALLFGNADQSNGMIQRLEAKKKTIHNVTSDDLQDALFQTMSSFKELAGWSSIPEVVTEDGRLYSNNNRSLYVLQAIQLVFCRRNRTIPLRIPYKPRKNISPCHEKSPANRCADMSVQFPRGFQKLRHPHTKQIRTMFQGDTVGRTWLHEEDFLAMVKQDEQAKTFFKTSSRFGGRKVSRSESRDAW